jgi:repressor LexA
MTLHGKAISGQHLSLKPQYVRVPVLGEIGAGKGASSIEYLPIVRWRDIRLPSWAKPYDRFFVAEICGDSLEPYVHDGDYAIVHKTVECKQGELVAILTPEGMLIKLYYIEGEQVRLESFNPEFPPQFFSTNEVTIQGRVVRTEHDW